MPASTVGGGIHRTASPPSISRSIMRRPSASSTASPNGRAAIQRTSCRDACIATKSLSQLSSTSVTPPPARPCSSATLSLRSNDAAKCQQIGESAHHLGLEGILAPSATGEGVVLAVFFDRLHADSQVRDVDHEPWTAPPLEPRPS